MDMRCLGGSFLAYFYNDIVGKLPSRKLRHLYLRSYLGSMGEKSSVQMHCRFLNGRKVHLGERNIVNFGCLLDGRRYSIRFGNDVSIGPRATVLTLGHDPQSPDFSDKGGDVVVGDRAWICYGAIILPGVKIGDGAVVGAGAVVTRDVESFDIVAGAPAKSVGKRNHLIGYHLSYAPRLV